MLERQRREKQKLADEILGQGRKSNAFKDGRRKPGTGPSLASRVGVSKVRKYRIPSYNRRNVTNCCPPQASQRSASNTPKPKPDIDAIWGHDLHSANNSRAPRITRPPRENPMARLKKDLLYDTAINQPERNGSSQGAVSKDLGGEISIRGTAGPYIVIGSNFAPGTTAADIESAMIPTGGEMLNCRILSASPTVIAEMVFSEKHNAESVISTFNNKKVAIMIWT